MDDNISNVIGSHRMLWLKRMWLIAMFLCLVGVLQVYLRFYILEDSGGALEFLPVVKVSKQVKSHDVTHEMMDVKVPPSAIHRQSQDLGDTNDWHINSTISSLLRQISHDPSRIANNSSSSVIHLPNALKKLRPSIFQDIPTTLIPGFKNPCYKTVDKRSSMVCMPYFFLLGTPKSGSTDLWAKLISHPETFGKKKEMHWWTRQSRVSKSTTLFNYGNRFIKPGITEARKAGKLLNTVIVGDGSASTFWDNNDWETFYPEYYDTGPPYVVADVIKFVLPYAKLIVSFRDPTTRLYSGYLYFNRLVPSRIVKRSPEDFHKRVVAEINSFQKCLASRSIRACVYTAEEYVRLRISLYVVPLLDWLRVFPRKQLFIVKLEEWHTNCGQILPEIYNFLEIKKLPKEQITDICNNKQENVYTAKENFGPMLNSTRDLLRNFYRPYVLELASVLNDTRFLWDYL